MGDIQVSIIGDKSVRNALDNLRVLATDHPSEANRILAKGLKEGGKYLIRKGRARARAGINANRSKYPNVVHNGNLLRSFTNRVKRNNSGVIVGFYQGSKGDRRNGQHAHLVDLGHNGQRGPARGSHFWTTTKSADTGAALVKVEEGVTAAVFKILH